MRNKKKVKLSITGDGSQLRCSMIGPDLLAAANSEAVVRFWNLANDENYVLSLAG